MNMVPKAEMTVETTSPHITWKPPLNEVLAISVALLIPVPFSLFCVSLMI
jgi:hypothetical protein